MWDIEIYVNTYMNKIKIMKKIVLYYAKLSGRSTSPNTTRIISRKTLNSPVDNPNREYNMT